MHYGKISFLFLSSFLVVLTKFSFYQKDWALGYDSMRLRHFPDIWYPAQQTFVGLEDVFKTSSRYVLKASSKRLQHNNFSSSKTSWRRLEDVLQRRLKYVLKTSWKHLGRQKIVTLKTSWRRLQDMSSRRFQDVYWECFTGNICF